MPPFNYKLEANRYRYYYQRLHVFYQKPVIQVSTAVLFTLATISFFAAFAIRPTLQTIAELLKKIDDQKQVLSLAQKKSASLATAQQQYNTISDKLFTLDAAIPASYQAQTLFTAIESLAAQLNIPLGSLRISDLSYPPQKSNSVQEMSFSLNLQGSYPAVKQFLVNLGQLPRFIVLNNVTISTPQKSSRANQENIVELTVNCTTFFAVNSGATNEISNQ